MNLFRDLKSPWLIHAKGALFVVLGLLSATVLLLQVPTLKTLALLCVTVWAFCRFYYYLFYVLERYLGRNQRFAGMTDALRYLIAKSAKPDPKS